MIYILKTQDIKLKGVTGWSYWRIHQQIWDCDAKVITLFAKGYASIEAIKDNFSNFLDIKGCSVYVGDMALQTPIEIQFLQLFKAYNQEFNSADIDTVEA
jgi:hypothetical protein